MIEEGQLITLDDGKEYIVIERINLHNVNYVYLVTNSKPLEIMIAVEKNKEGKYFLEEIKDNNELDYILNQFVLNKDFNEID